MTMEPDFIHLFAHTYESYRGIHPGSDGKGDNWQVWYSKWLLDVSDLPELLGYKPQSDDLQQKLLLLDKQYGELNSTVDWPEFMARGLFKEYC